LRAVRIGAEKNNHQVFLFGGISANYQRVYPGFPDIKFKIFVTTQLCETKLGKNGFPRIANRKASKARTPFFLSDGSGLLT
jgi:hypothetical protein